MWITLKELSKVVENMTVFTITVISTSGAEAKQQRTVSRPSPRHASSQALIAHPPAGRRCALDRLQ